MVLAIDSARYGLLQSVVDPDSYKRSVQRFREANILLPTFAQLADPSTIPADICSALNGVGRNEAHPLNLFSGSTGTTAGTARHRLKFPSTSCCQAS